MFYRHQNHEILEGVAIHHGIHYPLYSLWLDRQQRVVGHDYSDETWPIPEDWDLS